MYYELSAKILDEVKKAGKILINCHRNPDPDSIGSALATKMVLEKMGKEVSVVCPTKLDKAASFLRGFDQIQVIDFSKFGYEDFNLFMVLDSASWGMVSGANDIPRPKKLKFVVIDHHFTNDAFGDINLTDSKTTSTAELLFKIFSDWKVEIKDELSTALLTGIIYDTGAFRYPGVSSPTLLTAADLISKGADKEKIIYNIFNNLELNFLKMVGEMIRKTEIDEKAKFCWSAIPLSVYQEYGKPDGAKEYAANTFIASLAKVEFGMIMVETEEKNLSVSFRSRGGFDVSKVALVLGGGGHKAAAGARISGLEFDDAVKKVIETARKVANEV